MDRNELKLLVVLQCEWELDGRPRPRKQWERALWRSYTGKRLREMLPCDATVINATAQVGHTSSACFAPDSAHIQRWVDLVLPDVILVCGRVAKSGMAGVKTEAVCIETYHPAYRALSKDMTAAVRCELQEVLHGS